MGRAVGRAACLLAVLPCPAAPSSRGWASPGCSEGALQPGVTNGPILRCRARAQVRPQALALPNGVKAFPSHSPLPREELACPQAPLSYVLPKQ